MRVLSDNLRLVEEQRQRIADCMDEICAEAGARTMSGSSDLRKERAAYQRWYRATNSEKLFAYRRAWQAAHPPITEAYKEKHIAHIRAFTAARRRARAHERYLVNREHLIAYSKAWHAENRERVAEYRKAYGVANRDKIKEKARTCMARRLAAETPEKREARLAYLRAYAAARYVKRARPPVKSPEEKRETRRVYKNRPEIRERAREVARAWLKANPEARERKNERKRAHRAANLEIMKAREAEKNRQQWLLQSAAREFLRSQGIDIRDAAAAWAYIREAGFFPMDNGEQPNGK